MVGGLVDSKTVSDYTTFPLWIEDGRDRQDNVDSNPLPLTLREHFQSRVPVFEGFSDFELVYRYLVKRRRVGNVM